MNTSLRLSVVIPTRGRAGPLGECLRRLQCAAENASAVNATVEIIVSDDAGVTDPGLVANFPAATFIPGPMRGPAANRNHGARRATGEWLVFCDDDCLPPPELLRVYATHMAARADCHVLEGAIFADREKKHPLEEAPINDCGGNLWSCNFAIRRSVFWEIGGFCEQFPAPAGEDAELRHRLQKRGYKLQFIADACVIHHWHRRSARGYLQQQKRIWEADMIAVRLHPELRSNFSPLVVIKDIGRYYLRQFIPELYRMGLSVVAVQPLLLWSQFRRFLAYSSGVVRRGAAMQSLSSQGPSRQTS